MTLTNEEIRSRYELLCKASQPNSAMDVKLQQELSKLESLIKNDLVALTRQGCPDNITDILSSFDHELTRFRQFCEFPQLAAKSVVGIGGGFSAGKSSFINKLIGKKCLAVEVDPTTSMPAYVLKGAEESIKAINMHDCAIDLTQEELSTLTHEEKELYGSQVGLLLKSAFICTPDFKWDNLAFLDTPGYSKPEDFECNDRTDENLARDQLNTADYILWAVPVDNGTISEQDITFLSSLNKDIPKLVILTKADKKPSKDIESIATQIKTTLVNRGIAVSDVVPFSRKTKVNFPLDKVTAQLDLWNQQQNPILFAQHFKRLFIAYQNFFKEEKRSTFVRMDKINKILTMSEEEQTTESANVLLVKVTQELDALTSLSEAYDELNHSFFKQLNLIGDLVSVPLPEPNELSLINVDNTLINQLEKRVTLHSNDELTDMFPTILNGRIEDICYISNGLMLNSYRDIKDFNISGYMNREQFITMMLYFVFDVKYINELQSKVIGNYLIANQLPGNVTTYIRDVDELELDSFITLLIEDVVLFKNFISQSLALSWLGNFSFNKNTVTCCQYLYDIIGKVRVVKLDELIKTTWTYVVMFLSFEPEYIQKLANSSSWSVREVVALNSQLPLKLQNKFVDDEDDNIKAAFISSNNYIDISLQSTLVSVEDEYIRKLLAYNPSLDLDIQRKLSVDEDEYVRKALALNPSLYVEGQKQLADDAGDFEDCVIKALASNPSLHVEFQKKLSEHYDDFVKEALALNPSLCVECQITLADDYSDFVKKALASNNSLSIESQRKLADGFDDYSDDSVKKALASNPSLDLELQKKLVLESDLTIKESLASNSSLAPDVYRELALDDNTCVRIGFASNSSLNLDHYQKLLSDKNKDVRVALASNSSLNIQVYNRLVDDVELEVRKALASNSSLNGQVYDRLVDDVELEVRKALASNSALNNELYEKLALDDIEVRKILITNSSLKVEFYEDIYSDSIFSEMSNTISRMLGINCRILDLFPTSSDERSARANIKKRIAHAANPEIDLESQRALVCDDEDDVRENLASNPSITREIQEKLSVDDKDDVRENLASNPSITREIQEKLSVDDKGDVRENLASNPSICIKVQSELIKDRSWRVRELLASNPSLGVECQIKLATDNDVDVRKMLAFNLNLSLEAHNLLAHDNSYNVRKSVYMNPLNKVKGYDVTA